MLYIQDLIVHLTKNKIILNPRNFSSILSKLFNEKDLQIIKSDLLTNINLLNNLNSEDFNILENSEKLKLTSYVFLYFLPDGLFSIISDSNNSENTPHRSYLLNQPVNNTVNNVNNSKNIKLLNEFLTIFELLNIEDMILKLETDSYPLTNNNLINNLNINQGLNQIEKNLKNLNFTNQVSIISSINKREAAVSNYKFKQDFINKNNNINNSLTTLKFIKYLKLISVEEISFLNEISLLNDYSKKLNDKVNNKNRMQYFKPLITPKYSLDEYADFITNSEDYLNKEREKIAEQKLILRKKNLESYILPKDITTTNSNNNINNIKKFNLNDIGNKESKDEEVSDEEQRILNERKEYYSSGNTFKKG
ncbi:hypothetical protein CDIK_2895 [Cucumispora dikerogammari]|nr:hypothetical protein CDIK_2895 [Cucumispora dikerogammari]